MQKNQFKTFKTNYSFSATFCTVGGGGGGGGHSAFFRFLSKLRVSLIAGIQTQGSRTDRLEGGMWAGRPEKGKKKE
jgi:succinate dehydrogenase/fumarate reductase flavoprotein subunit